MGVVLSLCQDSFRCARGQQLLVAGRSRRGSRSRGVRLRSCAGCALCVVRDMAGGLAVLVVAVGVSSSSLSKGRVSCFGQLTEGS